ncbi:thiamin diphosphate-binding fold (THDP-binding) superfamily protein [Actinidia rufa]|uniref:Thiamin diphosphate-binding fold (THDP-binding) superfamily protein n=1 Tax=Actinidia rufa TaxID=165716 RepID=A0A7J0DBC0_9ERIC|nr:thiamin diphosphate-binding fold (THDP-binding) superfamily protein [Actinidia rufa]
MSGLSGGEENQFFDTRDEITSVSDLGSDCSDDCCSSSGFINFDANSLRYNETVDKTVRMWQLGDNQCLRVFSHNNYDEFLLPECDLCGIQSYPADDSYFVGGSIDGKVLIWEVRGRRVLDWIDIKEIVTAVSYYPSGKAQWREGSVSMISEFSPSDPTKVLVTSADSQVRVLCGADVIFKFKSKHRVMPGNFRKSGDCFFTADRRHVVLAGEDSNVYGSATWPEEKLPNSREMPVSPTMRRSEYKLLKSACQNMRTTSYLTENSVASRVDGGHSGSHVSDGLVLSVLETGVSIRGLDLPPLRALQGLERIFHKLSRNVLHRHHHHGDQRPIHLPQLLAAAAHRRDDVGRADTFFSDMTTMRRMEIAADSLQGEADPDLSRRTNFES